LRGDKLLIVDFFALLHRSRNALLRATAGLTTSDGRPTTGAYGFVNNLLSTIDSIKPSHVVVCYDAGGNWRKIESEDYKANRSKGDDEESAKFDFEAKLVLNELLPSMGIETVGIHGYEADDAIYTLSRNAVGFDEVVILTCDQDILQCVSDRVKVLLFNSAKKVSMMGLVEVCEKWGVAPPHIALVKALSGDKSDNITGIRGIGPKTASKLVVESYGILDTILSHPKIENYKEKVKSNLNLIRPSYVTELQSVDFANFALGKGTIDGVRETFDSLEFNALSRRLKKIGENLKLESTAQT
jgi:5'-3' exonuclease